MTIQIAVLCDAAADYSGKLNLLGTFDTIYSGQFPAVHPHCAIALRVSFTKMEEGRHQFKLNFVDEDGQSIMPHIDMPVDVVVPGDSTFVSRNFVVNIQGLKIDRPGLYSVDLSMDGEHEASIPLAVKQMGKGQPQQ
ncbi:MAG: DUF6941 family protein [Limisphaerales bacterium]